MAELKPYMKVITRNVFCAVCAVYEPHPFRASALRAAVMQIGHIPSGNIGVPDDVWCWVYYDWCGNPIGCSDKMPDGEIVDLFTEENLGDAKLAEYLNRENEIYVKAWWKAHETD